LTQGRARAFVEPSHYDEVPAHIAAQIVAKAGKVEMARG
ncbi:MAG: hypothetical protein UR20_C0034G0001, partial [Candidatus Woesebacteria bacterium GW2011_GWE2_31_6]